MKIKKFPLFLNGYAFRRQDNIFYRLKTGCQWRELPTKEFFSDRLLSWNSVYHHFNAWSKDDCWRKIWVNILSQNLKYLDLSSIEFDASHTPAKIGGDAVGYQGRNSSNTTNTLFLSDNQGVVLGMSTPQEGQHHDLFQIQTLFNEIWNLLKTARINLKGLFLNADSGFDSKEFQEVCQKEEIIANVKANSRNSANKQQEPYETGNHIFDDELYKDRAVIEHANAWIDGRCAAAL